MKFSDLKPKIKVRRKSDGKVGKVAFITELADGWFVDVPGEDRDIITEKTIDKWELVEEEEEEVTEEESSNYVQDLGIVEEYVPIVWDKLKLGQEVVDLKHKPVKRGKVFKKPYEHCIKVCFYGEFDAITYNKSEIKKHLRLVVKPEIKDDTGCVPTAKVMDENDPPVYENITGKPKQEDGSYKDNYLERIADSLEKIEKHLELIADVKGREWDSR